MYSRYNTMGRLKNYYHYEFIQEDNRPKVIKTKMNVRHKSLQIMIDVARTTKDYINTGLPMPVNEFSRPVGVIKDLKSKRGSSKRQYEQDFIVRDYLHYWEPDLLEKFNDEQVTVYSGDWEHSCENLRVMCDNNKPEVFSKKDILDGYFSRAGIDLTLPKLDYYDPEMIYDLWINPKASSGYITSKIVSEKRRISTRYTKPASVYYAKEIMSNNDYTFDKSLTDIGGREKRVSIDLDSDLRKLKTRLICSQEDIPTLIGQSVIKPINESLQKLNKGFNYGGRINGNQNFLRYLESMKCDIDEINFNPDFSGHDNHVKENNIVCGVAMLRLCYPESEEIDKLFIYLLSSLIFKRFVLPESGLVYEVIKGLSTGHPFTSIMTTLCSYGTLSTAMMKTINNKEDISKTYLQIAGDDVTGKVKTKYIQPINDIIRNESGFKMDDLIEYSGYFNTNSKDIRCTFLKKKYNNGMLSWNDEELFKNLISPTLKQKSYGSKIDNLKQMIFQAPFDYNLNNKIKTLIMMQLCDQSDKSFVPSVSYIKYKNEFKTNLDEFILKCGIRYGNNCFDPYNAVLRCNFKDYFRRDGPNNSLHKIDLKARLLYELESIDDVIRTKTKWFLRRVEYTSHRNVLRLSVFDIGKQQVKPSFKI